ncbi:MAG: hypothetical protein ACRENQ_06985 [Gemmatimonadaceae bacterium]
MNRFAIRLMAAAAVLMLPTVAFAQLTRPEFNIGVGPTIPSGQFSDHNPTGYNVTAGAGLPLRGSPLSLHLEGLYNTFNGRANYTLICGGGGTDCGRHAYVTAAMLNLRYDRLLPYNGRRGELRRGGTSTLYVTGGLGVYDVHQASDTVYVNNPGGGASAPAFRFRSRSVVGWNLGGGLRIPAGNVSLYVEARVHVINPAAAQFVPVSVGIVF